MGLTLNLTFRWQKKPQYADYKRQIFLRKNYLTLCAMVISRKNHPQWHKKLLFSRSKDALLPLFFRCFRHSERSEEPERSYMVQDREDLRAAWFKSCRSAGVCGATSTPRWLMDRVAEEILNFEF
jgi:4-hydroxy-3-methylbut-2-enyl diphosphate reductase